MFRSDQTIIQWTESITKDHEIALILQIQIFPPGQYITNLYKHYCVKTIKHHMQWFKKLKKVFYDLMLLIIFACVSVKTLLTVFQSKHSVKRECAMSEELILFRLEES
jgi:hypothetical protein